MDALVPNDPRVEHKFTSVGGDITYHYMLAKPEGKPIATVVLCHGWPDLGMGWRHQVPYLASLGLQVVVPDMLGFGQTSAPDSPEEYTMKKMAGHMAIIIREVTDEKVIFGGHDWGCGIVWRMTRYHPELVRALFSFCVPYAPPSPVPTTLEQIVERMPSFRYQLRIAAGDVENIVHAEPGRLRKFLDAVYGGRTPEGEAPFTSQRGLEPDKLDRVQPSPLVEPAMMEFYAAEYARHGLHGPCNWYRTREIGSADEVALARADPGFRVQLPTLLVMAGRDVYLPPTLADTQGKFFGEGLLRKEVIPDASHWVLIQTPDVCNKYLGEFLKDVLGNQLKPSL
ncbi:epoxide hydrolase [Xylariomycetidae sp. FL2044]|nr:epoxide hydrolase [Xylariomycetidae sp. FL2044]